MAATPLDACKHCRGSGMEPGLIPLPGLEPARLRSVRRDEAIVWQLRCPVCHHWADVDDDQLHGRVSIDHTDAGCGFHETHDLFALAGFGTSGMWEAWPDVKDGSDDKGGNPGER